MVIFKKRPHPLRTWELFSQITLLIINKMFNNRILSVYNRGFRILVFRNLLI